MGTDYAEKEREFIASLGEDTGASLESWMTAIAATGLADRNAIIDWLRHQGFAFSRASWLERIHHNGGRLIYADLSSAAVGDRAAEPPQRVGMEPAAQAEDQALLPPHRAETSDIALLLSAAKGLRPLADLILREIAAAVPNCHFEARPPLIIVCAPKAFAALWPQPKSLRLYGVFGLGGPLEARTSENVQKSAPPFPHMISLDDARRVDRSFREAVAAAAIRSQAL